MRIRHSEVLEEDRHRLVVYDLSICVLVDGSYIFLPEVATKYLCI